MVADETRKNTRHNLTVDTRLTDGTKISCKVMTQTRPGHWLNTSHPVILPFSIHTALYNGDEGKIKVSAFLQLVKSNVKGKVSVLFCEKAHVQVLSLKYKNDLAKATEACVQDANKLIDRFKEELEGCEVLHWTDFIDNDKDYAFFKNKVLDMYIYEPIWY